MSASSGGLSLGTLWVTISAAVDDAIKGIQKFGDDAGKVIDEQKKKWEGLATVGDGLTRMGAALTAGVTLPLVGVGVAAVKVASDLETARIGFTTMLGSAEAADSMLKDLRSFAQSTPFEFPDLVTAAQKMKALGFAADQIVPTLRTVGDTAAAMGQGKDVIDSITLALGQMSAKGKVSAEEMQQLAERGIPAWDILAKQIGVSVPEAMKLAEKGAISASQAVPALLAGMNERFGGSMDKMSKTLTGQWSNMKDTLTAALIPIGQTLIPILQKLLGVLTPVLELIARVATAFQQLPEPVKAFALTLAGMAAAAGPLSGSLGLLIKGVTEFGPLLTGLASKLGAAALAFGPWGIAIAVAAAALVALGVWVYNNWDKIVSTIAKGLVWLVDKIDAFAQIMAKIPGIGLGWQVIHNVLDVTKTKLQEVADAHDKTAAAAEASWTRQAAAVTKSVSTIDNVLTYLRGLDAQRAKDQEASDQRMHDAKVQTVKDLENEVKAKQTLLEQTKQDYANGLRSVQDVRAATLALADAEKKLAEGPEIVAKARKKAADEAKKQADERTKQLDREIAVMRSLGDLQNDEAKRIDLLKGKYAIMYTSAFGAYTQAIAVGKAVADLKLGPLQGELELALLTAQNGLKSAEALWKSGAISAADYQAAVEGVASAYTALQNYLDSHDLNKQLRELPAIIRNIDFGKINVAGVAKGIDEIDDAFKSVGSHTKIEFDGMAEQADKDMQIIAESAGTNSVAYMQAWLNKLKILKAEHEAFGTDWSDSEEQILKDLEAALSKHVQKEKSIWQKLGADIKNTLTTALADIGKRLIFGGGDENKQNEEAQANLLKSIGERDAAWAKYAADTGNELDQLHQKYVTDLAKEDDDLTKTLADRAKEYEKFSKDAQESIDGIIQKHEEEAAAESGKARDALDKKRQDYADYADEVAQSIEDAQQQYADSLENENEDLRRSLRDRGQQYQDFVDDANRDLQRLGEDTAQNIEDETQDTASNIDERQRDYNRYAEDTAEKIAEVRAKNGGVYTTEEADLQKSLSRKGEDLNSYIAEQNQKLERYTRDQKERQDREAQDTKIALDEKKRDYDEFLADRQADHDAEIAGYKAKEDAEIATLQSGLAEKKAALDQFEVDTAAALDTIATTHATEMASEVAAQQKALDDETAAYKQSVADAITESDGRKAAIAQSFQDDTAALQAELAQQLADYRQFRIDAAAEMDGLKADVKTIWSDIADIGKQALGSVADAALKLGAGKVIDKAADWLGIGSDAAGSAAKAGSGAASGAAGAAGQAAGMGVSAVAGIVTGAVSAVSGVVSNFQQYGMNKSLDIIVKHTLQTANDLANLRQDQWYQWGATYDRLGEMWRDEQSIMDAATNSYARLGELWRDIQTTMDTSSAIAEDVHAIAPDIDHCSQVLDQMLAHDASADKTAFTQMEQIVSIFERVARGMEGLAFGQQQMNVTLNGSDPATVAARLGTQLRLQGGRA